MRYNLACGCGATAVFDSGGGDYTVESKTQLAFENWNGKHAGCSGLGMLRQANLDLTAERDNLRRCVQWYAEGNHMQLNGDWEAPESGAEGCWLCPPSEYEGREPFDPRNPVDIAERPTHKIDFDAPWMVEDGSVARAVLAGGAMNTDPDDEETIVHAAPKNERDIRLGENEAPKRAIDSEGR